MPRGVLGDGAAVVVVDGHPPVDGGGQRGGPAEVVRAAPPAPRPAVLACVEVGVGGLVQLGLHRPVLREHGNADRRGGDRGGGLVDALERPGGVAAAQQHAELVPAQAPDGVRDAQGRAERVGHRAQQAVAGRVALGVVDALEVVEVEHRQRERHAVAPRARDLGGESLLEAAAVERAGQRVAARDPRELTALLLVVAALPAADPRGVGERDGEHEGVLGADAADQHGERQVREEVDRADDEHRAQRIGERRVHERQEEQGGERARRPAVDRGAHGDHEDEADAPADEEQLAPAAGDHALERQPADRQRRDERQHHEHGQHVAVRLVPRQGVVDRRVRAREDARVDPRAQRAQAELDLGRVGRWRDGSHKHVIGI
jgi:hypothetical protein